MGAQSGAGEAAGEAGWLEVPQMMTVMRQMEAAAGAGGLAQLSTATIAQQALMDAYLCLLHLTTAVMVRLLCSAYSKSRVPSHISCLPVRLLAEPTNLLRAPALCLQRSAWPQ